MGISPHYLALIESGEREPDQAIRRALEWAFAACGAGSLSALRISRQH